MSQLGIAADGYFYKPGDDPSKTQFVLFLRNTGGKISLGAAGYLLGVIVSRELQEVAPLSLPVATDSTVPAPTLAPSYAGVLTIKGSLYDVKTNRQIKDNIEAILFVEDIFDTAGAEHFGASLVMLDGDTELFNSGVVPCVPKGTGFVNIY